jgi:hypothetical protein
MRLADRRALDLGKLAFIVLALHDSIETGMYLEKFMPQSNRGRVERNYDVCPGQLNNWKRGWFVLTIDITEIQVKS